jgi:hypothetical protein
LLTAYINNISQNWDERLRSTHQPIKNNRAAALAWLLKSDAQFGTAGPG